MEEFEKRIEISKNRILIYRISEGYIKPTYTITEGFILNGEIIKDYMLSQWDDYGFNGWIKDNRNINKLSFEFDINHPLYLPLFHLLNYDDELLIDDDATIDDNKKYMLVHRNNNIIYIDFINDSNEIFKKFYVFIKNIVYDGRSKIDRDYKDTKKRLADFFKEVNKIFTMDYNQLSIEEYFLKNSDSNDVKELKKVFKRIL